MATKGAKKVFIEAKDAFLQYEEEIVTSPIFSGMPDLRCKNGSIQWEAPSNRKSGAFRFTHDKRYQWWINKAKEIGVSTEEKHWISKVAKLIHPTKLHPCKVCGKIMDTRYCYLSNNFIKRVNKLDFLDTPMVLSDTTHILDFLLEFVDMYGDAAFASLPKLLKCAQSKKIPKLNNDVAEWYNWIENEYIPKEPSMLGPGAMANPPDRLDGFHTYNRCCRPWADKGRTKDNLASYSTDRRAFENWSDGNWIKANKLMGYINSNSKLKQEFCANSKDGNIHHRPCSADHIGPISLGFCHRPEFQLLCQSCNSAKNNRMYLSDVKHLINVEKTGTTVVSWYANSIWQKCKMKVHDREDALRLSRIMRDNRNIAMMLLYECIEHDEYLFLYSLLNLHYADFEYTIKPDSLTIEQQIINIDFSQKVSALKYVNIQKMRKIRVAFSSLIDYGKKENRNGYVYTTPEIESLKADIFTKLKNKSDYFNKLNTKLKSALSNTTRRSAIEQFLNTTEYDVICEYNAFVESRKILTKIMDLVADNLSNMWDDPRYSREIKDE